MRPVLRRIAIHGAVTALILGLVGVGFAELASIWMAGSPGDRAATGAPVEGAGADDPVVSSVRTRLPVFMAAWGFGFVAVGEFVLHWWRSRKPAAPPAPPRPDETEKLLEELLAKVESASRQESGVGGQESGGRSPTEPPSAVS